MKQLMKTVKICVLTVFCILAVSISAQAEPGESHYWTHGDWTSRVLWEARYALSREKADGTSNNCFGSGTSYQCYGDWDYVTDPIYGDAYAKDGAAAEAYHPDFVGPLGPDGYGHFQGGECTFFVRLVLFRSTYWNFNDHYAMHNYPEGVYSNIDASKSHIESSPSNFQPGWMLVTPTETHYAIAEERDTVDGATGWWVIDSN